MLAIILFCFMKIQAINKFTTVKIPCLYRLRLMMRALTARIKKYASGHCASQA